MAATVNVTLEACSDFAIVAVASRGDQMLGTNGGLLQRQFSASVRK
jgi:hypothetical protein